MASPRRPQDGVADASRNPNVFDDEYAVEAPEAELDHRPLGRSTGQEPETSTRIRSRTPPHSRTERRSISNKETTQRGTQQRPWRSSIAKDPRDFAVGRSSSGTRTPSNNAEAQGDMRYRPTSIASEYAHFEDRSSTPVHGQGANGQSTSQFSQSGLPRSSFASHSPRRQSSVYTPARPAHPYGLYNQTTLGDVDDQTTDDTVAVGFPGRDNEFQRRIGPDGEEQAIIGPDGHTEELPPYSRYPDGNVKIAATTVVSVPTPQQALSSIRSTPGASSIEEPQRTPNLEAASPDRSADSSESTFNEKKSWKNKTFTEKRRTRVCWGCIPLWMLLTIFGAFFLSAVAIGGTVGGLLAAQKKR
jgi:hypothetical protein